MVTNFIENPPILENAQKYDQAAQKALENIESKREVQKKGNDYYIEGTKSIKDRRVLLTETLQLAAEISTALEPIVPEPSVLQEIWSQFAVDLGIEDLTRNKAQQTEKGDKQDIADYIELVDAATLISQLNDPEKIKNVDIATYTRMTKALNTYTIKSIKALFTAVGHAPDQKDKELYEIGLGIEDLVARATAIDMLSGYAEDHKDKKYEELSRKSHQPIVDLEPYFTGQDKNPNPWPLR
ncbi:hypothetical protein GYA27_00115 [candidate division WWE3 bacterium]|uniref:Uncharacterized protein n=1 Tax=candidate division WWE3 bacterium TaxID=2053526 RepID=A0A7X9DK46_UNCKA|nr:hypothetical protein [candidate division WWE3 bacterium]